MAMRMLRANGYTIRIVAKDEQSMRNRIAYWNKRLGINLSIDWD